MAEEIDDKNSLQALINNERLKLRATYLNGLAVAIFAVGGLVPVITAIATLSSPNTALTILTGVCFLMSFSLHYYAMISLGGLEK